MRVDVRLLLSKTVRVILRTRAVGSLASLLFRLATSDVREQFVDATNSRGAAEEHARDIRAWAGRLRQDASESSELAIALPTDEGDPDTMPLPAVNGPIPMANVENYQMFIQIQLHLTEQLVHSLVNHIGALWNKIDELEPPTAVRPSASVQ
jgi:hypothetical protein